MSIPGENTGVLGSDCEDSRLYNKCITEAGGAWCTMVIQCNGWKIPDDYPVKF